LIDHHRVTGDNLNRSTNAVKRSLTFLLLIGIACVILFIALPMLFLGPYFHGSKKSRLLSSLSLPDRSCLYLVQHWNSTPAEPYSVILYRLHTNGFAESCLIGFEEAYWWSGSLKQTNHDTVNVVSDGEIRYTYNFKTSAKTRGGGSVSYAVQQGDYTHISNQLWSINHKLNITQPSH